MNTKFIPFTIVIHLALTGPAFSYVSIHRTNPPESPQTLTYVEHDANEVRLGLVSSGQIGTQIFTGNGAGFWPKDTSNNYIFGTGLWIAGIADIDGDGEVEMNGIQGYDPLSGASEFAPGRVEDDPESIFSRLYVSTDAADLIDWPIEFRDEVDQPILYSLQDIVGIYNDVNGRNLFALGPLGIRVEQRSMAFAGGRNTHTIIFVWDLTNVSESLPNGPYTFEDAYIGLDSDMDIGYEFADDRTSFFTWQETDRGDSIPIMTAFAWDDDFDESNFDRIPGMIGVKYLFSPGDDTDGIDNDGDGLIDESPANGIDDDGDGLIDEWDEVDQLGLVNYTYHHSPSAPGLRPDPETDAEIWRMMACDPPSECVETDEKTDIRFLMSSGPFDWQPDQTVRVAIAYVFASPVGEPDHIDVSGDPPRPDPNDPVFAEFIATALEAQYMFDAGFPDSITGFSIYSTTDVRLTNRVNAPEQINAGIVSEEGVADARIFHSSDGGSSFEDEAMDPVGGHTWSGEIPGSGSWWDEVRYFVQAVDSSFLVERDPVNAPDSVYEYTIVYSPGFTSKDSVEGIDLSRPVPLAWLDYDRDGDLDLYCSDRYVRDTHLHRNDGGSRFVDVSEESGTLLEWTHAAGASCDYDNDGFEDIVAGTAEYSGAPLALFHNEGDGTFTDMAQELGLADSFRARELAWTDTDGDGLLDLLVREDDRIILFINHAGDGFADETSERGLSADPFISKRITAFDADGDHDEDLFLAGYTSRFYLNDSGTYADRTDESGLGFDGNHAIAFDADADLDLDLIISASGSSGGLFIMINDGRGHFTDASQTYGVDNSADSYEAHAGDLNAD